MGKWETAKEIFFVSSVTLVALTLLAVACAISVI